jgi:hypothetical protein
MVYRSYIVHLTAPNDAKPDLNFPVPRLIVNTFIPRVKTRGYKHATPPGLKYNCSSTFILVVVLNLSPRSVSSQTEINIKP